MASHGLLSVLVLVCSTWYAAGSLLIGQIDGNNAYPVTTISALIAGFMAMIGLTVWVVKRLLDKTIPDMSAAYLAAAAVQTQTFREMLKIKDEQVLAVLTAAEKRDKESMAVFQQSAKEAREEFKAMLVQIMALHEKQLAGFAQLANKDTEILSQTIARIGAAVERLSAAK